MEVESLFLARCPRRFCPTHPPSRKYTRSGFRSRMGETANYRLDPRAGYLVPVDGPVSKHELAGHGSPGYGQCPPRAAVSCSKLNSFLLAKQGYPQPTPSLVRYWLARLWALDSWSSFDTVRQRVRSNRSRLSAPPPKQSWVLFRLHYRWHFVKRCV